MAPLGTVKPLLIAITSSQRNFKQNLSALHRTLSGAYLHKLLTLFNLQGTQGRTEAEKQRFPRGALLIYHLNSGFVKRFFEVFLGIF